ncbi:MAG: hypothetical protein IJU48_00060 [Synergistaceae bacterium]|nr:hypothetical protein [Synergistaceae bacterium]
MATTTTVNKISVSIKLNNGLDTQGNVKTVGISLGSLSTSGYNADKVMAVVALLEECLAKEIVQVDRTEVASLETAA